MINFTGLTKKRVVNLGNRTRTSVAGSYLEQQRLQRLAREEQRERERRVALLKTYVRRYLEMRRLGETMASEWRGPVGEITKGDITSGNSSDSSGSSDAGSVAGSVAGSINGDSHQETVRDVEMTPPLPSSHSTITSYPQEINRDNSTTARSTSSEPMNTSSNNTSTIARWILQFQFLTKWTIPHQPSQITVHDLDLVYTRLCNHSTLNSRESTILTNSLVSLIDKFTKSDTHIIKVIMDCIQFLVREESNFPGLLKNLSSLIISTRLQSGEYSLHPDVLATCINLCFTVNFGDSQANFLEFLTIPRIFTVSESNLDVIRHCRFDLKEIRKLQNHQLINLLCNFLEIHGKESFTLEDYNVIGYLLECVTFSLQEEDDEGDNRSVASEDESLDFLVVEECDIQKIQELYSSEFIQQTIDYFVHEGYREKDMEDEGIVGSELSVLSSSVSNSACNSACNSASNSSNSSNSSNLHRSDLGLVILSTLIHLYPPLKNKLCMLITITPNSYKLFYNQILTTDIYKAFSENEGDILNSRQLEQLSPPLYFWKSVYAFEELYSYWLIVSNDLESFQDDKLNLEDVVDFLKFLRTLALTVIFQSEHFASTLKNISLALLNQLYLKNLRLHFLPENFWTPRELNINVHGMLQFVAEEEERRLLDEDNETIPTVLRVPSEMASKMEVLKKLPFFISFRDRVQIFQSLIELDRQRNGGNPFSFTMPLSKLLADIRRNHLLDDAFEAYHHAGSTFKNQLQVSFYNDYGKEAGIDGGGITKEFLTSVVNEGFDPKNGLFKSTTEHQVFPSDDIFMKLTKRVDVTSQTEKLKYLKFLGNVLGKCFYENVLIDISFTPFFLNKWCSMKNSINDLRTLDEELFRNLLKLIRMDDQELETLELTFSVNEVVDGRSCVFELVSGGDKIKVDLSNKLNYIHQVSNFKLNQSLQIQTKWFLGGLFEIVSASWLSMFDSFELQMLISGGENDVNIQDWKENVQYGGFFDDDVTVQYFWEVVEEMNMEERCKLLKFVTSVGRAPLLGFGALSPKFGIRNSGSDVDRLPTASTCVNLLKLPDYKNKELLRGKLMYSISMGSGFDLS